MERPTDLKRVLADEIRAAIAETSPAPGDGREADGFTSAGRASLSRAAEVLTPSVPAGAPLEPVKRLIIRALRFLWRNQSAFNSLSMDAASGLADAVDRLHRDVEELARRKGIEEARLSVLESGGRGGRPERHGGDAFGDRGDPAGGLRAVRGALPRQPGRGRARPAVLSRAAP